MGKTERCLLSMGKAERCLFLEYYLFTRLHAAEFVLSRWKILIRWSKTAHATIGLQSRHISAHGQPTSCRARPVNVDDGLEDIRWIRGLGARTCPRGPTLFSPKPEFLFYFLPSERDRDFLWPVFYTAAPKCVCIRRLASARHVSPAVLWCFCRSMSVEDSESRRFELTFWLSFSQADIGPRSGQEWFYSFFLESLELFLWRFVLIASRTEILWRVSLKFELFFGNIAFPLSSVLVSRYYNSCTGSCYMLVLCLVYLLL